MPEDEIPSVYISKPYFLEPDKKAQKAYVLLREALKRAKKVGIAKWVLRDKEHIAMLRPEGRALMLIELRFKDELREPEGLSLPESSEYSKRELDLALSLIEQLGDHWNANAFSDTYTEDLKRVIAQKAKGKPIKVAEAGEPVPTDMRDLMEALRKSLETQKRGRRTAVHA